MSEPLNGYLLYIEVDDTNDPVVSRFLRVPAALTFQELHETIQVAFGWATYHLWQFELQKVGEDGYPDPDQMTRISAKEESWMGSDLGIKHLSSRKTKLCDVFEEEAMLESILTYSYDFGDGWEHLIHWEGKTLCPINIPICISGEDHGVAEDAGGRPSSSKREV